MQSRYLPGVLPDGKLYRAIEGKDSVWDVRTGEVKKALKTGYPLVAMFAGVRRWLRPAMIHASLMEYLERTKRETPG